jgi:pimeloyl-ACP methyl ester carboxylesterase
MALTEEGLVEVEGMWSRWVRLASGAKAHYMTSGTTGPAVLLLHGGLPGSSGTAGWRFMAPFLGANGFRVYAPDMPAFGLSESSPEYWPVTMASHVDFIHEFVTALALDKFHISGNSMGCINTTNYIVAHPITEMRTARTPARGRSRTTQQVLQDERSGRGPREHGHEAQREGRGVAEVVAAVGEGVGLVQEAAEPAGLALLARQAEVPGGRGTPGAVGDHGPGEHGVGRAREALHEAGHDQQVHVSGRTRRRSRRRCRPRWR